MPHLHIDFILNFSFICQFSVPKCGVWFWYFFLSFFKNFMSNSALSGFDDEFLTYLPFALSTVWCLVYNIDFLSHLLTFVQFWYRILSHLPIILSCLLISVSQCGVWFGREMASNYGIMDLMDFSAKTSPITPNAASNSNHPTKIMELRSGACV